MCSGGSSQPAPDPWATAQAQNWSNQNAILGAANVNQINQVNPFGSLTYTGSYGAPPQFDSQGNLTSGGSGSSVDSAGNQKYLTYEGIQIPNPAYQGDSGRSGASTGNRTQVVSLNPQLQKLLDTQTGVANSLSSSAASRINQLPTDGFNIGDYANSQIDPNSHLATVFSDSGPIQNSFDSGGQVRTSYDNGGEIQRSFEGGSQPTVGNVQYGQIQDRLAPGLQNPGAGILGANQAAIQASYRGQTDLLQPQFQRQTDQLQSQLAAQGIPQGSAAYNDAIEQLRTAQNTTLQQAANSAVSQGFGQGLQAQGQIFGQGLQGAEFANAAQQQGFGQGVTNAQIANALNQQQYQQNMGQAAFANQAQQQAYDQSARAAQFANQAQQQQFMQNAALAAFANQAQQQQYDQDAARAQFFNNALQSNFTNSMAGGAYNINNGILGRNQNFNEASAFLTGSPVSPSNPSFQPSTQYQPAQAAPNLVGLAGSNYQSQQAANASGLGSIFGALGNVGAAAVCWVAREVFGETDGRWLMFRHWLTTRAPKWLHKLYLAHGQKFAAWIADKPRVKGVIRKMMERAIA